jgi:hypothetical protein
MFDFDSLSDNEKKQYSELMFTPLNSAQELKDWVRAFLGLELPLEITDPDSTSSPLDAIWQIYNTMRTNSGNINPGYILLSCREGMKTIGVAILETLLMVHFQIDIAHAAATEEQSSINIGYINNFINTIEPLLKFCGWTNQTRNKRTIKWKTPQKKTPFIKIVICTQKGMNSLHANILVLDELDLADPKALREGKNIVGYSKGINGIQVYLSTRKYAFGNMDKAIEEANEKHYKVIKWNILDVTEFCPPERHRPDEPKVDQYVTNNLPCRQIPKEEYDLLPDPEKHKWSLVKDAYAGCLDCLLLSICKKRLSEKPVTATGGFYKPITNIIQKFRENDPDICESQLMCWKPGSEGLVYPRFQSQLGKGNVITYKEAYETLMGPTTKPITELTLLNALHEAGVMFYAGVDWGYTHDTVIIVACILPNGEVWIFDTFASPGLEFSDVLLIAMSYRDKYKIQKWWVDQAMPANAKSFTKNGMKSPKFTKDVLGGIESIRSKIVNGSGLRLLKIIQRPENVRTITAISKHRFLLDGQGNPTMTPDDTRGIADICDSLRYIGQNMWPVKGSQKPCGTVSHVNGPEDVNQNPTVNEQMKQEIVNRIVDGGNLNGSASGRRGSFHWDFN